MIIFFDHMTIFDCSMKVTRKIPSMSVHLMESSVKSAESVEPEEPSQPSISKTRRRKRNKSSSRDQDKQQHESGQTGSPGHCEGDLSEISGLKLEMKEEPVKGPGPGNGRVCVSNGQRRGQDESQEKGSQRTDSNGAD